MILLGVPLVGIVLGVGLWAVLRGLGMLNVPGGEVSGPGLPVRRSREGRGPMTFRERVDSIRPGWLIGVIAVCGVWVLGWFILLVVGLSLLS